MIKMQKSHWLSGFQWYFFIFCNTVLIPPTLQSAFILFMNIKMNPQR